MAHGLANSWQALFGLRALLGFAEGSANPAGMKATSEWFPAAERGLAGGFFNMGASLGSMLARAARRVGDPDAQLAVRVRDHRRDRSRLGRAVAGVLSIPARSTRRSHRQNATTSSRARSATSPGKAQPSIRAHSRPAELLGHRHPAVPRRSDLGHADVLAAALSDDRARIRSEADRDVRVAAVSRRRSRLHVRRHDQHCAAEATAWV